MEAKMELVAIPVSKSNGGYIFPDKTERYAIKKQKFDAGKPYVEITEFPQNEAIRILMQGELFQQIVEANRMLVNEMVMTFTPVGLNIRVVDPAHVAMMTTSIAREEFVEYSLGHRYFKIAFDVNKLRELKISKKTGIISLIVDKTEVKSDMKSEMVDVEGMGKCNYRSLQYFADAVTLSYGNITHKLATLPYDSISLPKIPELKANNYVIVPLKEIRDITNSALKISDAVKFTLTKAGLEILCKNETEEKKVMIGNDQIKDKKCLTEKVVSLYPADYLAKICTAVKNTENVKISFNDDYPMEIEFLNTKIVNSEINIRYLLAPRMEH